MIIITGGLNNIGINIALNLLEKGEEVMILDYFDNGVETIYTL